MKKLVLILFILTLIWFLLQLYAAVASERNDIQLIPYLHDVQQANPDKKRMLFVNKMHNLKHLLFANKA